MKFENPLDTNYLNYDQTRALTRLYTDNRRKYHNVQHITNMYSIMKHDPSVIFFHGHEEDDVIDAIIYHDAIYEGLPTDVQKSVEIYKELNPNFRPNAVELILATEDHWADYSHFPPALENMIHSFIDLDLYDLGSNKYVYNENAYNLLMEYDLLTGKDTKETLEGRLAWLEKVLSYPAIYRTKYAQMYREAQARKNMADECENIKLVLASMEK